MGGGAGQLPVDSQANVGPAARSSIIKLNHHETGGGELCSTAASARRTAAVDPASVSAAEPVDDAAGGGSRVKLLRAVQSNGSKQKSREESASSKRRGGSHNRFRKDKWLASLYGAATKALRDEPRVVEDAVDMDAIVREALAASQQPDAVLREGNSHGGQKKEEQGLHCERNGAELPAAPRNETQPTLRKPRPQKSVPASMSMASSWWESPACNSSPSNKTDLASALPETGGKAGGTKSDQLIAVTEVHDMRAFGVKRSANIIAFNHQKACGGLYVPWLLSTNNATLETIICDAAILRLISIRMGETAKSPQLNKVWPFSAGEECFTWREGRLVQAAYNVQKRLRETVAKNDIQNIAVALNKAIRKTPESLPTIFAFGAHLLECRATLPAQDRSRNEYRATKFEEAPEFEALTHLEEEGADVLIPVDAPEEFEAPVRPPDKSAKTPTEARATVEAAERKNSSDRRKVSKATATEPWRLPLYRAFAILCYFSLHLYHLGGRPFDYTMKHVDHVFPRPWRVHYVGSVAWTEMTPFWTPKGELSPRGKIMLKKYKLTLKRRWRLPFGGWTKAVSTGTDSPKATKEKLLPFSVDYCMHDAAYACEDRSPMFVRLERRSGPQRTSEHSFKRTKITSAQSRVQEIASESILAKVKHLLLDLYRLMSPHSHPTASPAPPNDAGAQEEGHDKKPAQEQPTKSEETEGEEGGIKASDLPPENLQLHQADTLWLFKGTDNAKTWTINLMMEAIKDETFSSTGLVHQGFATLFHKVLRKPMTRFLREAAHHAAARSPESPYIVVLSGHSLGGALSTLAAWFLARNLKYFVDNGTLLIYCVSFGAPSVGNRAAVEELEASGLKIFRVLADADPVPFIGQTEGFTELYKSSKEIVLHLDDMQDVVIRGPDGRLVYSGAIWLEDILQPGRTIKRFLRLATATLNLSQFIRSHSNPLATHLHFVPCALSIMTGTLVQNGWSSFCASPLLGTWPHSPNILASEDEVVMKRAYETTLPKVLKKMESS